MGWTVRRNDLPRVLAALPRQIRGGIDGFGNELVEALTPRVWLRTGVLKATVQERERTHFHLVVGVGLNPARSGHGPAAAGFYAAFQEFGTVHQRARPVVGPTAHSMEPRYKAVMSGAVRDACRV